MDPQSFPYYLLGGVGGTALACWLLYAKVKDVSRHTETLCKMMEHQNNLLAHALNLSAPSPPGGPPPPPPK